MSDNLQEHNQRYFEYLAEIGLVDKDQYQHLVAKCSDKEEKRLVFEISNIFANFTASDWFELSCRVYTNWARGSETQSSQEETGQRAKLFSDDNQQRVPKDIRNVLSQYSQATQDTQIISRDVTTDRKVESRDEEQPRSKGLTAAQLIESSPMNYSRTTGDGMPSPTLTEQFRFRSKLARMVEAFARAGKRNMFDQLKRYHYYQKAVLKAYSISPTKKAASPTKSPIKKVSSPPKSPSNQTPNSAKKKRGFVENNYYLKLYADYFHQQEVLNQKRELTKQKEMQECTFNPKTNPVDASNQGLNNLLKVPVYERLGHIKPLPEEIFLQKQEFKELRGATFHPDISKSQKKIRSKYDYSDMSPEDAIARHTERLYSNAQEKEKNLFVKRMQHHDKEIEGCTFSPMVLSPSKNRKVDLSKSVERLYDDNVRRHRELLKKEVELREQELEECTFQPNRPARNYKPKKESDLFRNDIPTHERLYERSKKKDRRSVHETSLDEGNRSAKRLNRSQSATSERGTRAAGKKTVADILNINTPAFDRLYNEMIRRKQRLSELKEKVEKEEGITFHPQTNWSKKRERSNSANRSINSFRYSSKYESRYEENPSVYGKHSVFAGEGEQIEPRENEVQNTPVQE